MNHHTSMGSNTQPAGPGATGQNNVIEPAALKKDSQSTETGNTRQKLLAWLNKNVKPCQEYKLGRGGSLRPGHVTLEVMKFYRTSPGVAKVVGCEVTKGDITPVLNYLRYADELSGGGNGVRIVDIEEDGLYFFKDILGTSGRRWNEYLYLGSEGIYSLTRDEAYVLLELLYPLAFLRREELRQAEQRQRERLAELVEAIREERNLLQPVEVNGLKVFPTFRELDSKFRSDAAGDPDDEALVARYSLPTWECGHQSADTPEDAAAKYLEVEEQRAKAVSVAEAEAKEARLPSLNGTEKQVRWALQIRADYARKHPDSVTLKRATTAKYWIENRFNLG